MQPPLLLLPSLRFPTPLPLLLLWWWLATCILLLWLLERMFTT